MYKLLEVKGPQGILPCVYYRLDGAPVLDEKAGLFLCHLAYQPDGLRKGDLIVSMTPEEYEIAVKKIEIAVEKTAAEQT